MHTISETVERKFEHVIDIDDGWEIETDEGWQPVAQLMKTVPYQKWYLKLENGYYTECADNHIVFLSDMTEVFVKDLSVGDEISTDDGNSKVVSVYTDDEYENMFDIHVDTENHRYYANGILHHNTVSSMAYLLWVSQFVEDQKILIIGNKKAAASEIMERIRFSYEELPDFLRAGATEYNKESIIFDNGSKIEIVATTEDAARGKSISLLYFDELGFVPPNMQENLWSAVRPILSTGGRCIITSTPNGDNDLFANLFKGAADTLLPNGEERPDGLGANGFKSIKVTWERGYTFDENEKKVVRRNQAWADKEIAINGIEKFKREHCCEFLSGEETLVNGMSLQRLNGTEPMFRNGEVRWYKPIEPNKMYIVGMDPSTGTGSEGAAIEVFQLPEMIQVAEWCHNMVPPKGQVTALMDILVYIKMELLKNPSQNTPPDDNIYWSFENNGVGEAVVSIISETGEDKFPGNFVIDRSKRKRRIGLTTTHKPKLTACTKLKSLVESDRVKLYSKKYIDELKNYVRSGASFAHKPGKTDDLISASLIALRVLDIVKDYNPEFTTDLSDAIAAEEDVIPPMPFIMMGGR